MSTHRFREAAGELLTHEMSSLAQLVRSYTVALAAKSRGGVQAGSGVIWHPDGLVVTNAHVATRGRYTVTLPTGDRVDGEVIARDRDIDLAAVAIPVRGLHPAPLGEPAALRPGSLTLALGHPLGVANALALGIVHHVVRDDAGDPRWIAADIQLAPGNSGGPLVDASGRLVGINAMIVSGLGAAIPVDVVANFLNATVGRSAWSTEMWAA